MRKQIVLLIIFIIFIGIIFLNYNSGEITEADDNILVENNTIDFSSLTLKQKIAQMIIVRGDKYQKEFTDMNIGGIFLDRQNSNKKYKELINKYEGSSKIKLFVATDLEGYWNPFKEENFSSFLDIKTDKEAFEQGLKQGEFLNELGFNLNFAPVAEFEDRVYGGRVFSGTKEEIKNKLEGYIAGLQKNVLGTCKHYPGKGMINNTHYKANKQKISEEELELFESCFKNNISAVMVGHQVVYGELNSIGKPSSVSKEIISSIPENVLVVSDEVNMFGLRVFYLFNKKKKYRDLINAGENIILDFRLTPKSADRLIESLEKEVNKGKLNKSKINQSVKKILTLKGYEIK